MDNIQVDHGQRAPTGTSRAAGLRRLRSAADAGDPWPKIVKLVEIEDPPLAMRIQAECNPGFGNQHTVDFNNVKKQEMPQGNSRAYTLNRLKRTASQRVGLMSHAETFTDLYRPRQLEIKQMPKSEPRLELSLDRETAWTLRRLLQRFHHVAEFEYGGRTLSDTEDRHKRLEYALADNLENQVLRVMRRNGWEEEDEAPRY